MIDEPIFRTFEPAGERESADSPVHRLAGISVPRKVGPYFSTLDRDLVALGAYAAAAGHRVAREECASWARLGSDGGFELCADPQGAVWAVLLDYDEERRFVSSSPEAFAACLVELGDALRVILTTDQPAVASSAFETLQERLHARDPSAFADPEDWWPRVLDDIRDTASAENYAAFEYVDAEHGKRIVTQAGTITAHPEERLWDRLRAAGIGPEQVLRIHTDLQPCFMPGHYCSMWLAEVFPHVEVTHTISYGESADSRAEGIRLLRRNAGGTDDGTAAER
ncbi:nucleic acid/nucleotide deaminase domain-containing protein [Streptomyces guryensis]|uniref:SUKH-4 family immunity protein n=1 Tax=Streptomyces guryensis TaxID=2886947 RepID=A0A9Q3VZY1_9ACTN|nr:nucleic acid/nucleotide deaminase domain-containing protein [Streptomyces guryensis]MCD9880787.1 SUKH-4 family immunity protein [Streptomyces guryensis]